MRYHFSFPSPFSDLACQGGALRVACVLATHLRAKVELRRQPHLKETTAVIVYQ